MTALSGIEANFPKGKFILRGSLDNNNGWLEEELEEEEEDEDRVNDKEDDAEVNNPYDEADPHNRPPPTSDEETKFAPPVVQIDDTDDVPILLVIQFGSNFHVGESSVSRDLLAGNNEVYAPGLMCCDLKSVHRRVKRLSKQMHDRENRSKNSKMMKLITGLSREFTELKNQNRRAEELSHWEAWFVIDAWKEDIRAMSVQKELIEEVETFKVKLMSSAMPSTTKARIHLIDIKPVKLNSSYEVELANGKVVSTNSVLRGCALNLLDHLFDIDLMLIELGTFDVIVGMDWLVERDTLIVYGKKEVYVPYKNKTLVVKSDSGVSSLKVISCIKARKYIERGSQLFIAQVTEKELVKKQLQ
nr:reverse transcriptase domain-containing protein [Tanacetum cinerariifolium]